jgi:peptidoglycan/LPS O-acetylase OafA/YrhL
VGQNTNKHIIQIDGLRCYAVLSVMIAHYIVGNYGGAILSKIPFGTGVNLFFVISGYLITAILLHKKEAINQKTTTFFKEIKNFFVRRSLRIFPLYYLVLLFVFIFSFNQVKDYYDYLLSYTTNIYITIHNGYIDNRTHLWSLAVEEQFYLIWPFTLFLMPKKWMLSFIISIIFLSIISKYYFIYYTSYPLGANAFLTSCLDSLGLGALLAYLQLYHLSFFEKILNKKIVIILIISYIILFIFPDFTSYSVKRIFDNFFTSFIYFYIVGIASQNKFNGISKILLENKIALYLGKISYGIYLIHNFMGEAFQNYFARKLPPTDHLSIRIIYWTILTIILASISWYTIERPILKLKKYFN